MKFAYLIIFWVFVSLNLACQEKRAVVLFQKEGYKFPYNLDKTSAKISLPKSLDEVSGLTFLNKNTLLCIDDERGDVFEVDIKTSEIKKFPFGKNRDYEGIELVGDKLWVVKSNGNLSRIKDYSSDNPKVKHYKTALKQENDVEGLCYDPVNNALLLACKGYPYIDEKGGKNTKGVFAYGLDEKKLKKKPVIKIDLDDIKTLKKYNKLSLFGSDFLSELNPAKGDASFQPSGIAIHPKTGNIYIIASVGKLLLVLGQDGGFLYAQSLPPSVFRQPEGICFDNKSRLFISNEAKGMKSNILMFH